MEKEENNIYLQYINTDSGDASGLTTIRLWTNISVYHIGSSSATKLQVIGMEKIRRLSLDSPGAYNFAVHGYDKKNKKKRRK